MKSYNSKYRIDRSLDFHQISSDIYDGIYPKIGKGSGRVVYDLRNGMVVKEALNKKGYAQNEVEYQISSIDDSGLFAKVIKVSDGYRYLIMEKADRVKSITFVWDYFDARNNKELYRNRELKDISNKYHLLLQDLGRSANWGRIGGRPIIIDYGFTTQVRRKYY